MNQAVLDFNFNNKQTLAFISKAKEVFYGGAYGGGKSFLLRAVSIIWALDIPGLNVYLFRKTYGELHKSHMEGPSGYYQMLQPLVLSGDCEIVKEEIRFINGSRIFLNHLQHEEDANKYLSTEIHVLLIDEATMFSEQSYNLLRSRVRMTGIKLPEKYKGMFPRIMCASNPGNRSHSFFKQRFVDNAIDGQIRAFPPEQGGSRQFIKARLTDNPNLMAEDPDYIKRLQSMGSPEWVKAMVEGDWNIIAGAFFTEFSSDKHIIEPFEVPKYWTKIMGCDWGTAHPYAFVYGAVVSDDYYLEDRVLPRGSIIIYREIYGIKIVNGNAKFNTGVMQTPEEAAAIIQDVEVEKIDDRVIDPDLVKFTGGPTIAEMFARKGIHFRKADNKRVPGVGHIGGWTEVRNRLRGKEDQPMIYFFNTCQHMIRTFPLLQHDAHKPEDLDTNSEDHLADALRYLCMARPWIQEGPKTPKPLTSKLTFNDLIRDTQRRSKDYEKRIGQ